MYRLRYGMSTSHHRYGNPVAIAHVRRPSLSLMLSASSPPSSSIDASIDTAGIGARSDATWGAWEVHAAERQGETRVLMPGILPGNTRCACDGIGSGPTTPGCTATRTTSSHPPGDTGGTKPAPVGTITPLGSRHDFLSYRPLFAFIIGNHVRYDGT